MQNWQIWSIAAPLFFVIYQALSKTLPKGTSVFLVNAYASLIGAALMVLMHFWLAPHKSLALGPRTMGTALGIGVLISLGNLAIIKALSSGATQSGFAGLFNPLYIIYGVIVGLVIWHEKLTLPQIGGMAMILAGVVLVSYFKAA